MMSAGKIACSGAENRGHNRPSQFMLNGLLTTDKGEVGGKSFIEMQHYVESRKDPCRGKSCCFSKPI